MGETRGSGNWATEATLLRIRDAAEDSSGTLEKILAGITKRTRQTDTATQQTTRNLKGFGDALREYSNKVREGNRDYDRSVDDLLRSMDRRKRDAEKTKADAVRASQTASRVTTNFIENVTRTSTSVGSTGALLTTAITGIGNAASGIPLFGAAVAGATAGIASLVGQVFAARDTFTTMIQSGLLFNGSLTSFNTLTAAAGLSVEQFGAIAQQSSGAIRALGEQRFLNATTELRRTFVDFNLSVQQGAEYFAEYLETQRQSGLLYETVRGREIEAFQASIKQQQELAILTGASVAEQRRAARARAESARYRAQLASMAPEQRARIEQVSSGLASTGMSQQMIEAAIDTVIFGRTRPEYARMMTVMPELTEQLNRVIRTGTGSAEEVRDIGAAYRQGMEAPGRADLIRRLFDSQTMAGTAEALMNMQASIQAINNSGPELATTLENFRRTGTLLTPGTRGLNEAMDSINQVMSTFRASLLEVVGGSLEWLGSRLSTLRSIFEAFRDAPAGQGLTAIANFMQLGPESGARRVLESFDRSIIGGLGSLFTESLRGAWTLLIDMLTAWGRSFLNDLYEMMPRWMRGQRTGAAGAPAGPPGRGAALGSPGSVGVPQQDLWSNASYNMERIEQAVRQSSNLSATAQQDLRQQVEQMEFLRTQLEQQTNRSSGETDLLRQIIESIREGNRRLATAVQQNGP